MRRSLEGCHHSHEVVERVHADLSEYSSRGVHLSFGEVVDGNLVGLRLPFDKRLVELFETDPLLLFGRFAVDRDWVLPFAPLSPDLPLT